MTNTSFSLTVQNRTRRSRNPFVDDASLGATYRQIFTIAAKIGIVLVMPLGGGAAYSTVFILLAMWALRGPRHAIEAMSLCWLLSFLNPGLYPPAVGADILRWVVIGAALVSTVVHAVGSRRTVPRDWLWLFAFVATATLLALPVSYAVDVSLFKLISFFMGATAALLGMHYTRNDARYWTRWFTCFFVIVVIAGFPLIVHPLGYVRNGRGFQGLLNHPQTYTTFIGPLLAWHVARLITRDTRGAAMWGVAVLACVSLVATKGRTGVLACVIGLVLAGFHWIVLGRIRVTVPKGWIAVVLLCCGLGLSWIGFNLDDVSEAAQSFMLKGHVERSIDESFYRSRGFLLDKSMSNFRRQPLTGIGFGVASDPDAFIIRRDPILGLPVGASTEKGFTLVAVLEEVGLFGFAVFLMMVAAVIRPALSSEAPFSATVLAISALMVNFGEAVLFALGGTGLLIWLLLGLARIESVKRL